MRVLITGSSGQIGTNLGLRLLELGHEVLGLDLRENAWTDRLPLVRFDLTGEPGGWRVRLEWDGRDGLAGGPSAQGWDVDIRSGQPGARPYTVALDPAQAAWAMSLFSPGGSPADTSETVLGLAPYRRSDDSPAPWPSRAERVRSLPLSAAR